MKKILMLVVGAILLVVIAVVSTLAVVRMKDGSVNASPPAAAVAEEEAIAEDEDEEEGDEEELDDEEEDTDEEVDDEEEFDDEEEVDDEEDEEGAPRGADAIYHEFHPSFVVNITDGDRSRFLAIDVSVVGYSQANIDALRAHMPALRNDLIVLFSSQEAGPLRTQQGKEKLREDARQTIRAMMRRKIGNPAIDEVYFHKFVIQ